MRLSRLFWLLLHPLLLASSATDIASSALIPAVDTAIRAAAPNTTARGPTTTFPTPTRHAPAVAATLATTPIDTAATEHPTFAAAQRADVDRQLLRRLDGIRLL